MTRFSLIAAGIGLVVGAVNFNAAENSSARVPVLLELFTSEGCSSCPPADRLLESLEQKQPLAGADLIVLSEHVDYWNNLGWKDPYSSAQYTTRQQEYTQKYNLDGVYTPQLVIDGRFGVVGSDSHAVSGAVQKVIGDRKVPVAISHAARNGNEVVARVEIPAEQNLKGSLGVLYVVLAENRAESHIARGENSGRFLAHVAVTRILKRVGDVDLSSASAKDISLTVQPGAGANGLRVVAFIQDSQSGRVLGVAGQKL
jgi:hypothetical protein